MHTLQINSLILMSSTCIEPEDSSSVRQLFGIEHTLLPTRLLIPMRVKRTITVYTAVFLKIHPRVRNT